MNVLIIGSGGREHALAWKVAQSPRLTKLYIAPGNGGTDACGENVPMDVADHEAVLRFCKEKQIDLVIVGPEIPLAAGLVDSLSEGGIRCFGPKSSRGADRGVESLCKGFYGAASYPNRAICHVHSIG